MTTARAKWIACGFSLMLTSAYLDNLRGPLLPVLRRVFSLSYGETSWFLVSGQFASVLCTFALIPLSRKFGSARLAVGVCVLGAVTALVAPLVGHYAALIALACALGASISALGAMANVLVIDGTHDHHRSRFLCGVHMMYGLGSVLGPALCATLLVRGFSWSTLLWLDFPPLVMLGLFALTSLSPLDASAPSETGYRKIAWTPRVVLTLFLFAVYVAAEVLTSSWLVVYLVEKRGLSVALAAPYLSGFFVMMGVSRASCFFLIRPRWERAVMWGCLIVGAACFLAGRCGWFVGFSLAGILGPFFPLLMARMSRDFPRESQTMALWVLTTMYLSLSVCHLSVGYFTDRIGIANTYWLPAIFFALSLFGLWLYFQGEAIAVEPAL